MGIIITNLNKSYNEKSILKNFSLTVNNGSFCILTGASGIGKTTLLRILLGLEVYDSGDIINSFTHPAVVFQENRLCESFSALENVELTNTNKAVSPSTILSTLGLSDSITLPVAKLSGGMKRRVALARALAFDFDLLILDEPFKGLDDETKYSVIDCMLNYSTNKTVLMVTHDQSEISYISARCDVNLVSL